MRFALDPTGGCSIMVESIKLLSCDIFFHFSSKGQTCQSYFRGFVAGQGGSGVPRPLGEGT